MWLNKPLATLGKDFDSSFEESGFFLAASFLGRALDAMLITQGSYIVER